jgi:molybdopterin synthase catalytic subunit
MKDALDYEGIMRAILKNSRDNSRAIITYVGLVRPPELGGRRIKEFVIEADHESSGIALRQICEEAKKKFGVQFAVIYLFEGSFQVGDTLVIVAVAGKAHPEVFSALDEVARRFVHEGHIRKKEVYEDGGFKWIES